VQPGYMAGGRTGHFSEECMEVFNRTNSKNTGALQTLTSWMLISPRNTSTRNISMQVSEIPVASEQPVHSHSPEQCYYIIKGKGLMIVGGETREVSEGDAVYIPSNRKHGIKNTGTIVLEYLTANSPAFDKEHEDSLWPADPT
jgi:mannose-6-phosphate isomerase-like protein (cupin superfamily)